MEIILLFLNFELFSFIYLFIYLFIHSFIYFRLVTENESNRQFFFILFLKIICSLQMTFRV